MSNLILNKERRRIFAQFLLYYQQIVLYQIIKHYFCRRHLKRILRYQFVLMKLSIRLFTLFAILFFASCSSYKQVPYLKDSKAFSGDTSQIKQPLFDARIMPKDLLSVTVSSSNPEASVPYNLTVPTIQTPQVLQYTTTQPILQTYLVDNNGNIMFPILGELHLGGLTKSEAEAYIINRLKPSFKEAPIVNVRLVNYKISVLGEVQNPNTFTVANEKINIFEALALAGDMTIYGKREKVKLLREDSEGRKNIVELDLNRSDVVNSPYFYLQQNDVVYVEPNKAKARNADIGQATSLMLSGTSILISVASLIVNIVR